MAERGSVAVAAPSRGWGSDPAQHGAADTLLLRLCSTPPGGDGGTPPWVGAAYAAATAPGPRQRRQRLGLGRRWGWPGGGGLGAGAGEGGGGGGGRALLGEAVVAGAVGGGDGELQLAAWEALCVAAAPVRGECWAGSWMSVWLRGLWWLGAA